MCTLVIIWAVALSTAFSQETVLMSIVRNGFQEQLSSSTTYARAVMEKSTYQEGE